MSTDLEPIPYGECEDCNDQSNPKKVMRGSRRTVAFSDVRDPVQEEMKDTDLALYVYDQVPIVPFFDGSDATLRVMRRMAELSPTHGGCISNIGEFCFGGELATRRFVEPGLAMDSENLAVLTPAENKEFSDFVKSLNPDQSFEDYLNITIEIFKNLKTYGNAWLRIDEVTVAGKKFYYFESIDTEKCRYYATPPGATKYIVLSPDWTTVFMSDNPPEIVAAHPAWSDNGRKRSTIMHIKNKVVGRDWYGLPDAFASLYSQYTETQIGQHSAEGYANDFVARVAFFIAAEPEDEAGDTDDFSDAVEATFTNRASQYGNAGPRRFIINRRLTGDPDPIVHEFKANTDHEFHTATSTRCEREIIKTHNWHTMLMGMPTPGKLGANQEFKEVYKQYYNNVIRPWQERCLRPLIKGMREAEKLRDGSNKVTDRFSLGLFNLYSEYLKVEAVAADQIVSEQNKPAEIAKKVMENASV